MRNKSARILLKKNKKKKIKKIKENKKRCPQQRSAYTHAETYLITQFCEGFVIELRVELGNQLFVNVWVAEDVVSDGGGRVGGRVASGDELVAEMRAEG